MTDRGRYKLVESRNELALPSEDYFTSSTQGPFIDTDRDDPFGNRINISKTTVEEFARVIGWVPGEEAATAFAAAKTVESENVLLRDKYDQLVNACRSVLDLQEYLQHSPAAESRAAHPAGKSRKGNDGSSDESGSNSPSL